VGRIGWVTTRRFEPDISSAPAVRRFVDGELRDRTDPEVLETVLLVVSELATNAILHARSTFEVEVHTDGCVRIVVADGSPELPVARHPMATDQSGRGLVILEHLCSRTGTEPRPPGKAVWCEIDLPGGGQMS
jgi:anti-sigma regulatory factor (Ser/Thr protein kinase)